MISFLNFFWDMLKWRQARKDRAEDKEEKRQEKEKNDRDKAESKKEKVTTGLGIHHFEDTYDIYIEVLDTSEITIPIREVVVNQVTSRIPYDMIFSRSFFSANGSELPPRRRAQFLLPAQKLSVDEMKELCALPSADLWLSVSSEVGEIDRISGELLQTFFQQQILSRENLPEWLATKSLVMQFTGQQPIQASLDNLQLRRMAREVKAVRKANRWSKGDIRYSFTLHFRNKLGFEVKLHRLQIEFRKDKAVIYSEEIPLRNKTVDLPALKWVSHEVCLGLRGRCVSVLDRSNSVWMRAESIGDGGKHEWLVYIFASPANGQP